MPESLCSGIGVACAHSCAKASDAAVAKDMSSVNRYAVDSISSGMLHIGVRSLYSCHLEMGEAERIQGRRALFVRKPARMNYGSFVDHSAGYFLQRFLKDCDMARYLYYERQW
ncbi:MAG: hypothetical protein PUK05_02900 [Peptoniphilaceae bacterium]|nr:hypothetical protein [Peptoniphilaceae bacterium]